MWKPKTDIYLLGLFLSVLFYLSQAEVFTSMVELEDLIESEKDVVDTLEDYLAAEEARLQRVRR